MSHYAVKITSGEIVYGTFDEPNLGDKMIVINNPLIWEDYEAEDGRVGSALVKYITGTDEDQVGISISSIISVSAMNEEFTRFYDVAVEVQKITDEAYKEKLQYMTRRMLSLVIEYQNKQHAENTGDIVFTSPTDTDTTIH